MDGWKAAEAIEIPLGVVREAIELPFGVHIWQGEGEVLEVSHHWFECILLYFKTEMYSTRRES